MNWISVDKKLPETSELVLARKSCDKETFLASCLWDRKRGAYVTKEVESLARQLKELE